MPEELTFGRDGLTFRVTVNGPPDGASVILLHGFPGSRRTWHAVTDRLRASGIRTAALEQRGYGPAARPHDVAAYRLAELAADVVTLADELGAARWHLVGHDWGGIVAWYLAATQPARWASLTVLSTPHPRVLQAALRSTGLMADGPAVRRAPGDSGRRRPQLRASFRHPSDLPRSVR